MENKKKREILLAVAAVFISLFLYRFFGRMVKGLVEDEFLGNMLAQAVFALLVLAAVLLLKKTEIFRSDLNALINGWFSAGFLLFLILRNCPDGSLGFERFVICALPDTLYRNYLTAYLGFPQAGFFSTDYFSLIPWFFLFLTGYFLMGITSRANLNEKLFAKGRFPLLNFLGKHSLVVYLLHQPILYGLGILYFYCIK